MTNKKKIMMKALIVAVMFFGCLLLLNQLYNEFSSTSKGKKK